MTKFIAKIIVALIAISLCSCGKMIENNLEKIQFNSIESFRVMGLSGVEIGASITNETGKKITLLDSEIQIVNNNTLIGNATLVNPVTLEPHATQTVKVRLKLNVGNPLNMLALLGDVMQGQSPKSLKFIVTGHAKIGMIKMKIQPQTIAAKEIMRIFEGKN